MPPSRVRDNRLVSEVVEPGSASAQAEWGIVLASVALRLGAVVVAVVGVPRGLSVADQPQLYLVTTLVALIVSGWLVTCAVRRRDMRRGRWQGADLLVGALALPALAGALPAHELVGTQAGWAPGYALNVACLAGAYLPRLAALLYAVLVASLTFVVGLRSPAHLDTLLANSLVPIVFAVVAAIFAGHFRGLGERADTARAAEVRATRALELERYRLTVHDATGILRQLADDATPAEVRPALRRQAAAEANRLRNYLRDGSGAQAAPGTIGEVLDEALAGFTDLPLEVSTDLGGGVALPPEQAMALGRAVATVLHNVRRHAEAATVYVHADARDQEWEVVVRDDGSGFDPAEQPLGFGLQVQVLQALTEAGMTAAIDSAPGEGTAVTIRGRLS